MHFTLLSLFSISSALSWIVVLILGIIVLITGFKNIFHHSATVASMEEWVVGCLIPIVIVVTTLSFANVILLLLTGGDTNAH